MSAIIDWLNLNWMYVVMAILVIFIFTYFILTRRGKKPLPVELEQIKTHSLQLTKQCVRSDVLTPSWLSMTQLYFYWIERGSTEQKQNAKEEIMRLAKIVDKVNEMR